MAQKNIPIRDLSDEQLAERLVKLRTWRNAVMGIMIGGFVFIAIYANVRTGSGTVLANTCDVLVGILAVGILLSLRLGIVCRKELNGIRREMALRADGQAQPPKMAKGR